MRLDVLAARGEHHQELRLRLHRFREHHLAQALTGGRAARLARALERRAARLQKMAQRFELGRLPRPVDPFEGDEGSACLGSGHGLFRPFCQRATARLCSSSVRENSLDPSPRATK